MVFLQETDQLSFAKIYSLYTKISNTVPIITLAAVVVFELIPCATACFPLTAEGALCVDANLAEDAVVTVDQALIYI